MPYLYGASVQGIQNFIFATNRLREIVGGSELVEQLCTTTFRAFLKEMDPDGECELIVAAAGNIRLVCADEEVLRGLVRHWPRKATEHAPGITIIQAVVTFEGMLRKTDMNMLEDRLKAQRNRPIRPSFPALMAMERCRRTGAPAVDRVKARGDEVELTDWPTRKKLKACGQSVGALLSKMIPPGVEGSDAHIPFEMADIVGKKESSWIAVVHADGNSLGKMIQGMAGKLDGADEGSLKRAYRGFSEALNAATCQAAQDAFGKVVLAPGVGVGGEGKEWKYPIRPVVLGGDDLTVICRADFALEFAAEFLRLFQVETRRTLASLVRDFKLTEFENGLTACAGVSFVKQTYPFHYAIDLAESLCARAKRRAKEIDDVNVPGCMAFHKVQSSFVTDYQDIVDRELTTDSGIRFEAGPYAVDDTPGLRRLDDLMTDSKRLLGPDAPRSGLRQWLSALYRDRSEANQLMTRLRQVHGETSADLLQRALPSGDTTSPAYDWMTIASLKGGERHA